MRQLIVIPFKDGSLLKAGKKEGWASILVVETILTMNNGIINPRKRVGAIRGKKEDLEALQLKSGDDFNKKMEQLGGKECRVIYTETSEPQYEGHQPKVNPRTKEVVKDAHGNPIYLSAEVGDATLPDQLVGNAKAVIATSGAEKIA